MMLRKCWKMRVWSFGWFNMAYLETLGAGYVLGGLVAMGLCFVRLLVTGWGEGVGSKRTFEAEVWAERLEYDYWR